MSTAVSTSAPIPRVEELGRGTGGSSRVCSAFTLQQNLQLSALQLNPRDKRGRDAQHEVSIAAGAVLEAQAGSFTDDV